MRSALAFWVVTTSLTLVGCSEPKFPDWIMVEKAPFQMLYQPDGRLDRLLYDGNGDGRAEMVVIYAPNGKPLVSEIDTDIDGVVDRWEYFDSRGNLARTGHARHTPGTADAWEVVDKAGEPSRFEFDENGDGKVDRSEYLSNGQVFLEELDTDHDGKPDRRSFRAPDGSILRVQADKDGDGYWETSLPIPR